MIHQSDITKTDLRHTTYILYVLEQTKLLGIHYHMASVFLPFFFFRDINHIRFSGTHNFAVTL